jgi:hypothetical protein
VSLERGALLAEVSLERCPPDRGVIKREAEASLERGSLLAEVSLERGSLLAEVSLERGALLTEVSETLVKQ